MKARDEKARKAIVRRLYQAFSEENEAGLREVLHPDVEWVQCSGFPGRGRHRGVKDVLRKVFRTRRAD